MRGLSRCAIAVAMGLGISCGGAYAAETMTIAHLYPESLENNDVAPALLQFKQLVEKGTRRGDRGRNFRVRRAWFRG